jgi:hypothetical protein
MAKKGNRWLSRGMGGLVGGWVAKLVARQLVTATLWVRIRPGDPSKTTKGRHKQRISQHTLARKKYI